MYKSNSNKPSGKKSIDGFLSYRPRNPQNTEKRSSKDEGRIFNPRNNKLDNFDKKEGFRSNQTAVLNNSGNYDRTSLDLGYGSTTKRKRLAKIRLNKNKKQKNGNKKRLIFKSFALISVVMLVAIGWIFGKAWWDANRALGGGGDSAALNREVDPNSLNGEGDGRINVLLMGKGGPNHDGGDLTDSMLVASIDPINDAVALVSIPRDLWVKPNNLWPMKINAVYSSAKNQALYKNPKDEKAAERAGIEAAESTVEQYLGIKINYYGMVDFSAFEEAVNILGGINVKLDEPYSDPTMYIGTKMLNLPAGDVYLDGATALGYARSRYGSERGDFDRGDHQQRVIVGIKNKALSLGTFGNPVKVSKLVDTFGNRVQTNFSLNDIMRFYELSKKINETNISNVDLAKDGEAVLQTGMIGGQSVVYPIAGVNDFSEVQKYIRGKLIDSFIIKEQPTVIILNGTTRPGAAKLRADELKSYGYNVLQIADAPNTNITSTTLVDTTNGAKKYTKRYMELRFDTKAVKEIKGMDLSPYIADYIVVIGPNG